MSIKLKSERERYFHIARNACNHQFWPKEENFYGTLQTNDVAQKLFDTATDFLNRKDLCSLEQTETSYKELAKRWKKETRYPGDAQAALEKATDQRAPIEKEIAELMSQRHQQSHILGNRYCRALLKENRQLKRQLKLLEPKLARPKSQWISHAPSLSESNGKWKFQRVKPYDRLAQKGQKNETDQ
jgi:hypothetical protein